jgi:excisionase family DNA binding protein
MYDNELITKNTERVTSFFQSIDRMLDGIENMVRNCKPTLGGERYLTDKELSAKLRISRRTLQDYRNEGRIPYYQFGGKTLYKESDLQQLLEDGYRKAFRE